MRLLDEFKEFAIKGNVMDLAVGVIIGGAFGKITTSLVEDVMMPVVTFIMGGELDFNNMFIVLGKTPEGVAPTLTALRAAGIPVFAYGSFLTILLNFIILAFIVFLMVKALNRLRRQSSQKDAPPNVPTPSEEILLLREISEKLSANRSLN